jgi:EAL domain-containing protein (putative c-di-GMP-specific phosphodiesterase class I)
LEETGLKPQCLQLEITESAMAKNLQNTVQTLKELNEIGVNVALDDFGTGYSSLNYLHELPISTLKIDRSFITRLNSETNGAEIIKTIITLARNLKMEVVAEGIETVEQLEKLREIGCEFGQGYLFSRPIAAEEAIKLISPKNSSIAKQKSNLRLISGG